MLDVLLEKKMNEKSLSALQLSRQIKVTRGTIYHWLAGRALPQGDNRHKLASALDVPISDIVRAALQEKIKSKTKLGKIIIRHLELQAISHEEFAQQIKASRMAVHNWITGTAIPTSNSLRKVARGLGVPVAELRLQISEESEFAKAATAKMSCSTQAVNESGAQ